MLSSPVLSAIKLSPLKQYIVNKAWRVRRSPTCNQVLFTYDVSHVINFTRLSPFSFVRGESLGTRLHVGHCCHLLCILQYVKEKYTARGATTGGCDEGMAVEFESSSISLELPSGEVSGWKILPNFLPKVKKVLCALLDKICNWD